jgi:hypothetical protein
MLLAQLTLRHQLLPADPLQASTAPDLVPLFDEGLPRGAASDVNAFAD